jgi:hypothetical protein
MSDPMGVVELPAGIRLENGTAGRRRIRDAPDSDRSATSQAELIEPTMQEALKVQLSLEARRRLEPLLNALCHIPAPEPLRAVRAHEMIGNIETPAVLQGLVKSAAGARRKREQKDSLERPNKQASPRAVDTPCANVVRYAMRPVRANNGSIFVCLRPFSLLREKADFPVPGSVAVAAIRLQRLPAAMRSYGPPASSGKAIHCAPWR